MSQSRATWSYQDTSLERSFFWSLAVTTLPVASGFAVSWVVARFAGPTILGTVSWAMSFATAVLILGKFGLELATSRLASEYGRSTPSLLRSLFRTGVRLRLVFTVSVAALVLLLAHPIARALRDPALVNPIRVASVVVLCASLYEFKENFLIGLNRMKTVYGIRSIHLLSRILITAALVFLGIGATGILGGYCVAWIFAITIYIVLLSRYLPPGTRTLPRGTTGRILTLSVTLAVSSASVTIYSHMDRLMLGYFSGVEEVGQYAVARNITEVSLFPAFAMVMMLRPTLAARYSAGEIGDCSRIIGNSLRFSLASGVLFGSIFAILGVPLVVVVFSERFHYAGELMVFFVAVIVLRSVGSVILPALIAAERTRAYALLTGASAVVNFGLNVVLIPIYSARGAIVATIVSYAILMGGGLREVFSAYGIRPGRLAASLAARTILAGIISVTLFWLLIDRSRPTWDSLLWAVLLSLLYVFLVLALRVSNLSDVRKLLVNLRQPKG